MNKRLSQNDFQNKIRQLFPQDDISIIEYNGASKRIIYKCNKCDKIHFKTRANHMYENKYLCSCDYEIRDSKIRDKIYNFINNQEQFSMIENWSGKTSEKIHFKCSKCGNDFFKTSSSNYSQLDSFCPFCGKNGCKIEKDIFIERMIENNKADYTILDYKNFTSKIKIKHNKCGFIFSQLPNNFLRGKGCPKCNSNISRGEQKIINFLQNNDISFIRQYKFKELGNKSYDFFLPQYNCLIEYNGEQHYKPSGYFGGQQKFIAQQKSDKIKEEYARNKNLNLLIIPYWDYENIENILSNFISSTTKVEEVLEKGNPSKDDDIVYSYGKP